MRRAVASTILFAVLFAHAAASAQAGDSVTTSAVIIPIDDATRGQATLVGIGIRRGIEDIDGLEFEHPADVLSVHEMPEEVTQAVERLDALAPRLDSDPAAVGSAAEEIIEVFERNLGHVRRASLIDAYMLAALARCEDGDRSGCRRGFERVITFRENADYDPGRYPPDHISLFDETRERLVARGSRGAVEVVTEPEGGEVFIDGRSYGASPVVAEGLLVGDHYVTVKVVGYDKLIRRVTVSPTRQETVMLELERSERARLLEDELPHIREELGQRRVELASRIARLANVLFVNQIVLGTVEPAPGDQLRVRLYLYDLRTRFLLKQKMATIPGDAAGVVEARRLAVELYEGVDLSGAVEAPEQEEDPLIEQAGPFWQQWWFWAAVGVVAVSGIVAISVIDTDEEIPEGWTRIDGQL